MSDWGYWQGAERATGNLAATGMKLMEFQAERADRAERMKLEEDRLKMEEDRNIQQTNLLKQQAQEQEWLNTNIDVDDTLNKLGIKMPLEREFTLKKIAPYLQDGVVKNADGTPRQVISRRHGLAVLTELQKNPQESLQLDVARAQDYQDVLNALHSTLPEDADPNDKKTAATMAQIQKLSKERDTLQNHIMNQTRLLHKDKFITVKEGERVYDPSTNTFIAEGGPKKQKTIERTVDLGGKVEYIYSDGTREVKDKTAIPASGSLSPVPGGDSVNAFEGLTKNQQETVKAIAEYRFPVSNLRNKEMMGLVQRAYLYDPTFDAKEYATRAAVRKDFTSGKSSQTSLSLNTAVGHLASLAKAGEELDNSSLQIWNAIKNKGLTAIDDPRTVKFNTAANAVAGELATVFKNTSGTDQEIKSWHDKISSSQGPKQLKASIQEAIHLIGSRLEALHNKYTQGMGKAANFQILSPKSRTILQGLGVNVDAYDPASSVGGSQSGGAGDDMSKFWKK